jgi:phospholipid/cholesterol/gamma-HCH transport system permease protein
MFIDLFEWAGRFTHFAFRSLFAVVAAVTRPGEVLRQFYSVFLGAFPLALVAGAALGVVIWMHTRTVLAQTSPGTEQLFPRFLAVAVLLELAPVGAGLIVAARTGASLGAELGSMRQTEQIDALELLGLSAVRELVGPRVLACMLALPLLDVFIAVVAIGGGYASEALTGGMRWATYEAQALHQLRLEDVIPATLKTVAFGFLVGVAGCYYGMTAEGGTEGVGRAATRGVVLATLLVLIADVLLVGVIQLVMSVLHIRL